MYKDVPIYVSFVLRSMLLRILEKPKSAILI